MKQVIQRPEMLTASIDLGTRLIPLSDFATTGLKAVAVGPSGCGKTNIGLLMAEQLCTQGWVCILVDPEGELESMYGKAVESAKQLRELLVDRSQPIVVVAPKDAKEFTAYGQVVMDVADEHRKPMLLVIDEGQLFSAPKRSKGDIGDSSALIEDMVGRGRKRALDLFVTALGFTGAIHRSIFRQAGLTFIGGLSDPAGWAALAPQFRSVGLGYGDLQALAPGEFFVVGRSGIAKCRIAIASRLKEVAMRAPEVARMLPQSFTQWDAAMLAIPTDRLRSLTAPVVSLLATLSGLSAEQLDAGMRALGDELAIR